MVLLFIKEAYSKTVCYVISMLTLYILNLLHFFLNVYNIFVCLIQSWTIGLKNDPTQLSQIAWI